MPPGRVQRHQSRHGSSTQGSPAPHKSPLCGTSLCRTYGTPSRPAPEFRLVGKAAVFPALLLVAVMATPFLAAQTAETVPPRGGAPLAMLRAATSLPSSDGRGVVTNLLSAELRCSETLARTADATLEWSLGLPTDALLQRVQLSKLREGFVTGRFEESQDLPAVADRLMIGAPEPGIVYRWRIGVLHLGGDWSKSDEGRFEVPICPGDGA